MLTGWDAPNQGVLFVVSGPSGTGKSTLLKRVFDTIPGLEFSVSATTRSPRAGEQDGREYHFVDRSHFEQMILDHELLEHARVYDNYYGTPRAPVEAAMLEGRSIVLDIDVQGATQIRHSMPEAVSIFILPPSLESLRQRLVQRGTDSPEVIERRMNQASQQLQKIADYDFLVMNESLDTATAQLQGIFLAELSRSWRRERWLQRFRA